MTAYYELLPDIFGKYVPTLLDVLQDEITFIGGAVISHPMPKPLVFETDHSSKEPPSGLHGMVHPVMSHAFVEALQQSGVSNLQCFPAELRSTVDNCVWTNYYAVNIIGLVACADLGASQFTHIIDRPGDNAVPLMAFEDLKVDPMLPKGSLFFRLAESPGTIIVAARVVKYLQSLRSDEEWGITIDPRG
jgi:hypothetical protein